MAISESVINRRNYLVEWLKTELKSMPVSIYGEEEIVNIRFQDLLICGVQVGEETYRIFNATDDWEEKTTYHCELDEDKTWYYYVESADECIAECKRLVMFEAKKNTKKNDGEYSDAPLVSEFWEAKIRELLGGIVKQSVESGILYERNKKLVRFECYGDGPANRMRVYLNNENQKSPEIISVWIGYSVLPQREVNPGNGKFRDKDIECNVKFEISKSNRQVDIQEAFDFIRDVMTKVKNRQDDR